MVIVGDAPFVSDSILDARTKARYPSNVRVKHKLSAKKMPRKSWRSIYIFFSIT